MKGGARKEETVGWDGKGEIKRMDRGRSLSSTLI